MASFNPYFVDEIVTQGNHGQSMFGLIGSDQAHRTELFGYEVTITGEVVEPLLSPQLNEHSRQAFSPLELEYPAELVGLRQVEGK
jgi:hypothetical protein